MSNHYKRKQTLQFTVKEASLLLPFLLQSMPNRGRNSVKSILRRGQVTVDGRTKTKHNIELHPGQTVAILRNQAAIQQSKLFGVSILYEDDDLIIIHKDAGLLSIATHREKQRTAHHQLMNYVRNEHPGNRVFIVHRLDQETSGVMMFAKNEQAQQKLQDNWEMNVKERVYIALVEGKVEKESGIITSWLKETKTYRMYSSMKKDDGLFAKTEYRTLQSNDEFSLLEIRLHTGRKNQIRVHMQDLGHPVAGDKKYGAQTRPIRRLGLHAKKLAFKHPKTGKLIEIESPFPKVFRAKSRGK